MSSAFVKLRKFITDEMRMSHIYQPVMLMELLRHGGKASTSQIAQAILTRDPTQLEYYSEIVKSMVGRVLTKNRGITEKEGDHYALKDAVNLSGEESSELIRLCSEKISEYEEKRKGAIWDHRRRGHRPVSGSIRYEVLKRASFRCELCGISADEKNLEVDHITPKSLGGSDDISNYQALCYTCNAQKKNNDDTDFRSIKNEYGVRESGCVFCEIQHANPSKIIRESTLARRHGRSPRAFLAGGSFREDRGRG